MTRLLVAGYLLLALPAAAQWAAPAPLPPPIWDNAETMLRLGNRASRGEGVPKDEALALRYYQRAAELGSLVAMDNVGNYYGLGRGVPVDRVRAIAWCRRAAAGGYAPAMSNLGVLYSASFQGKPDPCQALAWFKRAAEAGNATGMWHLGQAYQQGRCPKTQSKKLARQWLQNAVDIGRQPRATAPDQYAAAQAAQDLRKL